MECFAIIFILLSFQAYSKEQERKPAQETGMHYLDCQKVADITVISIIKGGFSNYVKLEGCSDRNASTAGDRVKDKSINISIPVTKKMADLDKDLATGYLELIRLAYLKNEMISVSISEDNLKDYNSGTPGALYSEKVEALSLGLED